jgi:hypothetical protein
MQQFHPYTPILNWVPATILVRAGAARRGGVTAATAPARDPGRRTTAVAARPRDTSPKIV